jgi:hypothetical protein
MKTTIGLSLLFLFASSAAHALNYAAMNVAQRAEFEHFANTEVRADFAANADARMLEAAMNSPVSAERITESNIDILIDGAFEALVADYPSLTKSEFALSIRRILSKYETAPPVAITLGGMLRAAGMIPGIPIDAGGSGGVQYNFYVTDHQLKMSKYYIAGIQGGVGTAMAKIELYASLCFGGCFGGDPQGAYIGFDESGAAGLGAGFFHEYGIDVTDLYWHLMGKRQYGLDELVSANVYYVGFSLEYGEGTGISGNLFYYWENGDEVALSKPGQTINASMLTSAVKGLLRF